MQSILDFPTSVDKLHTYNPNMTNAYLRQYTPSRDISGSNFPKGNICFEWMNGANQSFVPAKSFMTMRVSVKQIRKNGGELEPILSSADLSLTMGLMAHLFSSVEVKLNGKTIERIGGYLPQIDAMKTRHNKSKVWMDSVGKHTNLWSPSMNERRQQCSINGYMNDSSPMTPILYGQAYTAQEFGFHPHAHTVGYDAEKQLLTFDTHGDVPPSLDVQTEQVLRSGDLITLQGKQIQVQNVLSPRTALALVVGGNGGNVTVDNDSLDNHNFTVQPIAHSRDNMIQPKNCLELVWQPPLGFFEIGHAIPPGGNWTLEFTPEGENFKKRVVESIMRDLTASSVSGAGSIANNYDFTVDRMFLHLYTLNSNRFQNGTYYLDILNTRCQATHLPTNCTGGVQKAFDVEGKTTSLGLAFQDQLSGTDTRYSASKFKIRPTKNAPEGQELLLSRFSIDYNSQKQPCPAFDGSYHFNIRSHVSQPQHLTLRYADTLLQTQGFHAEGGGESLSDYIERGPLHQFEWYKDPDQRSTRVTVDAQFSAPFGPGESHQMLLFNQWRSAWKITNKNGLVDLNDIQEF